MGHLLNAGIQCIMYHPHNNIHATVLLNLTTVLVMYLLSDFIPSCFIS